jgi:hypothetical protein
MVGDVFELVGPERAVQVFGVRLVGINAVNGMKLLFTAVLVVLVLLLGRALRWAAGRVVRSTENKRAEFWSRQGVHLATTVLLIIGVLSI